MRKRVVALLLCGVLAGMTGCSSEGVLQEEYSSIVSEKNELEETETTKGENKETKKESIVRSEKEILFCDIPWGTSYTTVNQLHGEWNLMPIAGEGFISPSVDAVLLDDTLKGIDFEYNNINIIGNALNPETNVAGYQTSDIKLYFAYNVIDGVLSKTEESSSLYGAHYKINPVDLQSATNDLISKITSLYGEPASNTNDLDMWGNYTTYVYWYGANDTELVLKSTDTSKDTTDLYEDEITISYAWRKGDELMQSASDVEKAFASNEESNVYGNDFTDGL